MNDAPSDDAKTGEAVGEHVRTAAARKRFLPFGPVPLVPNLTQLPRGTRFAARALEIIAHDLVNFRNTEMTMIRKLILGTASVLVLGIGSAALDSSADADNVPNAVETSAPGTSQHWVNAANLSKDDIRWAQVELHDLGLYQPTADALIGNTGIGQGSSMPPKGAGAASMTNSSGTSGFGSPGQK